MKEESGIKDTNNHSLLASRNKMFIGLIGAAIAFSALTVLAPISGDRVFYSDVLAVIASGSAFALCIQVIYRQKLKELFPRLYASLGLGLGLWFIAELIWAYYELVGGIEIPFPSVADGFWLAGYIPFAYFLIGILRNFLGISKSLFLPVLLSSSVGIVLLGNILLSIYQTADLTTQDGVVSYILGSAYPIADMFLIVPAIAAFIQLRKGMLTFTPWAFIVIATIVFIIADIGFAYFALVEGMEDMIWVWNPLYNLGDLAIASSLLWHKQFFTIDEKKLLRQWQHRNR